MGGADTEAPVPRNLSEHSPAKASLEGRGSSCLAEVCSSSCCWEFLDTASACSEPSEPQSSVWVSAPNSRVDPLCPHLWQEGKPGKVPVEGQLELLLGASELSGTSGCFPSVEPTLLMEPGAFWLLSECEDTKIPHLSSPVPAASVARAGMLGVSTAGAPPGLSAQGVLLQQGFVSPAPAGGIKSTLGSSETTAGPCTGAVPPNHSFAPGSGALPQAGAHPRAPRGSSWAQGSQRDPQRCCGAQLFPEPALTCLGFKALSYLLQQLGLVVKSPQWRCWQPGFMASVVSLSWLQLGKSWRGMKGAARAGMAGEHFKGSQSRVGILGILLLQPSRTSSSLSLLKHSPKTIWSQSQAPAAELWSCPQQVSLHPQTVKCQLAQAGQQPRPTQGFHGT